MGAFASRRASAGKAPEVADLRGRSTTFGQFFNMTTGIPKAGEPAEGTSEKTPHEYDLQGRYDRKVFRFDPSHPARWAEMHYVGDATQYSTSRPEDWWHYLSTVASFKAVFTFYLVSEVSLALGFGLLFWIVAALAGMDTQRSGDIVESDVTIPGLFETCLLISLKSISPLANIDHG